MSHEKTTILIVDDEKEACDLVAKLLRPLNCNLVFAGTGLEALDQALTVFPDLILLDIMLPAMDGYEVCQRLREDPLLSQVPIIMVTALDDRDSRLKGIEVGADDFISKPFDRIELRTRVQTVIRLDRYRRLLTERTKFEWVIDQAEDGYVVVNKDSDILFANPKARLYFGLPIDSDSLRDETLYNLIDKQYRREPVAAWSNWPRAAEGSSPRYLIRSETQSSNAFWLQVDVLDLPTGSEQDITVRLRDITETVNLQRQMHSFHAMISHKLRTPLVGIYNGLELVLEYANNVSDSRIVEIGQVILHSMDRFRAVIDAIVEYLYTPKLLEIDAGFELSQLARVVTKLSATLGMESVIVSGHDAFNNSKVLLSQQTVELVLWEILENSKKFHPTASPSIEVVVSPSDSGQVNLRILDDGLHLSPEQLRQVWIPYYQGDKYFTGEITGMGLGLSMAAMVTWGAGGKYNIYNREDKAGIVVELTLPLHKIS